MISTHSVWSYLAINLLLLRLNIEFSETINFWLLLYAWPNSRKTWFWYTQVFRQIYPLNVPFWHNWPSIFTSFVFQRLSDPCRPEHSYQFLSPFYCTFWKYRWYPIIYSVFRTSTLTKINHFKDSLSAYWLPIFSRLFFIS